MASTKISALSALTAPATDDEFVVVDTAPTGHALLLLDATGSYHREVVRQLGDRQFVTPLMRLQDPAETKVVIVTLAETTPVLEAAGLQAELERAGIHPWAWVVNNSLAAAHPVSPLLVQRAAAELADSGPRVILTGGRRTGADRDGADRLRRPRRGGAPARG